MPLFAEAAMELKILAVLRVLGRGRIVLKCFFTILKKHYSALRILWVLQIIFYRVHMMFVIDMLYTTMVPKNSMIHILDLGPRYRFVSHFVLETHRYLSCLCS
jgi:hypothetical protein